MFERLKQILSDKYQPGKIRTHGANSGLSIESDRADWWRERQADWAKMDETINPIIQANRLAAEERAHLEIVEKNSRQR